ncbi:MAG: alpha/beta hydrolase [Planctomycetes bacterium]|nr:alpha/beta hydrolase [Planctomycetota bacterium]
MSLILPLLLVVAFQEEQFGRQNQPLPQAVEVHLDLVYGKAGETDLKLDLYRRRDRRGKQPAVVFIHGGGWRDGDKSVNAGWCGWLADLGFIVASINYRLKVEGRFPAALEDCQTAVHWLRRNADKYGIDKDHFGAIGHSAGGHLATLLAYWNGANIEERVQAVVGIAGVYNFVPDGSLKPKRRVEFLGASYEERPEVFKRASPLNHVSEDDPPTLLFHGDKDPAVPIRQAEDLKRKLEEKKLTVELIVVKNGDHALAGPDASPKIGELDANIAAFFERYLRAAKK